MGIALPGRMLGMTGTRRSYVSAWSQTGIDWTATGIAEAVQRGSLHPRRAVSEALDRIAKRDGEIGAFQTLRAAAARTEADSLASRPDLASLPLAGVPIAIKDNVAVSGEPMRQGSAATSARPQTQDHPVVARLRAAGAVIVGITRMPELGLYAVTDSVYGVTRNPWNLKRTAGGSSGGSGAAVAAGMVPVAHGTDGLGSVRIPAASCGLIGIKPGTGVVPSELGSTNWYGMAENGVLATNSADGALLLSVMAGAPGLADLVPPGRLLVVAAATNSPLVGVRPDSAYVRAVNSVATILARTGNEVHLADFHYSQRSVMYAFARWFACAADEVRSVGGAAHVESRVRTQARLGRWIRKSPAMDPRLRETLVAEADQFLAAYDLLLTPALARPPVPARAWSTGSLRRTMFGTLTWTPYLAPWNVAGFPAIVVPTGKLHPRTRTPLAVQIVAKPGSEGLLLGVAAALERFRPWPAVAPAYR